MRKGSSGYAPHSPSCRLPYCPRLHDVHHWHHHCFCALTADLYLASSWNESWSTIREKMITDTRKLVWINSGGNFRGKQRGLENSGESGKTYHKTPPQKRYAPPPPVCSRNVIFVGGNGHRPDQSHSRSPPKLVLEVCPPPSKVARVVWPPPLSRCLRINRDKPKGTTGAKFTVFRRVSLIFAVPGIHSIWEAQIFAGNRRFSQKRQETAEFRRNPFVPFSLSLLIPSRITDTDFVIPEIFSLN